MRGGFQKDSQLRNPAEKRRGNLRSLSTNYLKGHEYRMTAGQKKETRRDPKVNPSKGGARNFRGGEEYPAGELSRLMIKSTGGVKKMREALVPRGGS